MGRKEEQRGKVMPGRVRLFFVKLRSDLYAQNGTKAELQGDIR